MCALPEVQTGKNDPIYNIGAVSRMTGISMATLRAWERRYTFPDSQRTQGGHRLYSERDIFRLRWVKERIEEGMQTAQSIKALKKQEETGHLIEVDQLTDLKIPQKGAHKAYIEVFSDRLFEALVIKRDILLADKIFNDALAFIAPEELILHGITPVLSRIGEGWETGDVTVTVEHLATNYLRQRLLFWMLTGPPALINKPIILACAPGEWHEGSLLILGAILRRRRYPVTYLGQSVPGSDLENFIHDMNTPLVVLVAMLEETATHLVEWSVNFARKEKAGVPIIGYGGRVFVGKPEWQQKMKGIYLGDSLEEGIQAIDRLL
jgi:DNA-binding transcriptional MerR regulator